MCEVIWSLITASEKLKRDVTITGIQNDFYYDNPGHKVHIDGRAIDVRTQDVADVKRFVEVIKECVSDDVEVFVMEKPMHLHIQW